MTATAQLIAALTAGGMSAAEAAGLVARAAVEMTGALTQKSAGASRQRRYRERHKASQTVTHEESPIVTKRNESVTRDAGANASQSVTEASQTVTSLRHDETAISYLLTSSSKDLSEKKESKKERATKKRNAPLRDDWQPSRRSYEVAEQHGVSLQIVEQIFRDYLKSSGKLYADYDAAFNNFLRNQRNFGNGKNGTVPSKSGSLVDSINRELAALEQSEGAHFELPESRVYRLSK